MPYRASQARIASRTRSRVHSRAIAPGWHFLQWAYASPFPLRALVGAPHPGRRPGTAP